MVATVNSTSNDRRALRTISATIRRCFQLSELVPTRDQSPARSVRTERKKPGGKRLRVNKVFVEKTDVRLLQRSNPQQSETRRERVAPSSIRTIPSAPEFHRIMPAHILSWLAGCTAGRDLVTIAR